MATQPETQWISNFNVGGLNLYTNPLFHSFDSQVLQEDGELIRAVNVKSYPLGAKMQREGYTTFLGTTQTGGSSINNLHTWTKDDGTSVFLYAYAGGIMNYASVGGTQTDWLPMGNGTFTGTHVGISILNNVMIAGDGVGSTRHSTDGTSFTNTTLAPTSEFFESYQNRIYCTQGSSVFYSSYNDATNWSIALPNDSSSFTVLGQGSITKLFKTGDRLHICKANRDIFRWDGNSLVDLATTMGPSSPYSFGTSEDSVFYLTRLGINMCDPSGPQLLSNPIRGLVYNEAQTGVSGSAFGTSPGGIHNYDYYVSVGSVQDDFTSEPLNNAVFNYNFQKNEWLTYQFNDKPTAFCSYVDNVGSKQLVFGNSTGQVFQLSGSATSDNGNPISSVMEMIFHCNIPYLDKQWRWFFGFFNPGAEAQLSIAPTDTFVRGKKNWIDLGDATSGLIKYRFPTGLRSKLLHVRIRNASRTSRYIFYGATIGFVPIDPG